MQMPLQMPFRSAQRVYFDDLDALNILHNARYVLFMERARGELFNALGLHWADPLEKNPDKVHVVAETRTRFLAPFRGEGEIAVLVRPAMLGTSSLVLEAKVESLDGRTVFAEGETRLVRLDPGTFRPCPWSARFRELVAALLPPGTPQAPRAPSALPLASVLFDDPPPSAVPAGQAPKQAPAPGARVVPPPLPPEDPAEKKRAERSARVTPRRSRPPAAAAGPATSSGSKAAERPARSGPPPLPVEAPKKASGPAVPPPMDRCDACKRWLDARKVHASSGGKRCEDCAAKAR